jgi:two-component system LytT family sensor kinase
MENRAKRQSADPTLPDRMMFRYRGWQHLIFWAGVVFILFNIFNTSGSFERIDLIYTLLFLVPLLGVSYLNLYLAIPLLLKKERYGWYILSFLLLTGTGALWLYFQFDRWIDHFLPHYYFISYYTLPQLLIFTGSTLMLTTLLKLSRSWFMMLRIERLHTRNQLKALQHQLNPHFLLNSLQTIYALSLEQSDQTPRAILQLADILKYTLYETDHPKVKLEKEIELIRDYVEMYRFRVDPGRVEIRLKVTGEPGSMVIAPMLLVPFVENCFKHGLHGGAAREGIFLGLHITPGRLEFSSLNSLGKGETSEPAPQKGIGIENTKKRLQLIYPGKHHLVIRRTGGQFSVNLQIELESWDPVPA